MLDIDHFKQVNDTYGHPTGDAVICDLVSRVQHVLSTTNSIGRVGGEEFTILLEGHTLMQAVALASQLHHDLNRMPLSVLPQQRVTASFGVSWRHRRPASMRYTVQQTPRSIRPKKRKKQSGVSISRSLSDCRRSGSRP